MTANPVASRSAWPSLQIAGWRDTCATLHLWLQIVGKVRLKQTPWVNHSWHVTLYVTARGLTTSPIPQQSRTFEIDLDFIDHRLTIQTSDGDVSGFPLAPRSVASFYKQLMAELERLGLPVRIYPKPNEIPDPIHAFPEDEEHASYDPEYAHRLWQVLAQADRVFKDFRSRFIGKTSPVHLFWGAPDLAVTRFSGRPAPEHPGGIPHLPDWVTQEAYSHEVSSCGFWPGGPGADAAFYAYAYPEPKGFAEARVRPAQAFYHRDLREFILPYEALRGAADPDAELMGFLQSTYEAAADLAGWDRAALERKEGKK